MNNLSLRHVSNLVFERKRPGRPPNHECLQTVSRHQGGLADLRSIKRALIRYFPILLNIVVFTTTSNVCMVIHACNIDKPLD